MQVLVFKMCRFSWKGFEAKFNLATYQVGPALWERCHISLGSEGEGGTVAKFECEIASVTGNTVQAGCRGKSALD